MSRDLSEILSAASIEELHQLRDIVLTADKWSTDDRIKISYTDPKIDGPYLGREIRKFGGNTVANVFRDEGPDYKEIVEDVADKIEANYREGSSVEEVESAVINKVLGEAWAKMGDAEREALITDFKLSGKAWMGGASAAALQAAFLAGGAQSYAILASVVNVFVMRTIGVGLAGFVATRSATALLGPIGLAFTGLTTALLLAGPSYKVTIPSVVFIAYLRRKQEAVQCGWCEAIILASSAKFCPECGEEMPQSGE